MSLTEIFADAPNIAQRRPASAILPIPAIASGQVWLIEASAEGVDEPIAHALAAANVVIYDRALGPLIVEALPLGTYAEPAGAAEVERCVRFARDGWSVLRLLPPGRPQRDRERHIRSLVDELAAAQVSASLPVRVIAAIGGGIREQTIVRLDRLADVVAIFDRKSAITMVIDAFDRPVAANSSAAANGLAG